MRMTAEPISRNCNKQITRAWGKKADARVIFVIVVMLPLHRIDLCRRDFAPAGATKGLSDRPLETFGAHSCLLSCAESYLVSVPLFRPNKHYHIVTWEAKAKGSRGRPQTSSVFIALLSPPQRRNPCLRKRPAMFERPATRSRPSGATQHRCWKEQLGGASEEARSYWQGRFAACALCCFFSFGMVARGTVGALPQTPPEAPPLDSARGIAP